MECTDIQRIENYLENGDPYTFVLLLVDSTNLFKEQSEYLDAETAVKGFQKIARGRFSSGTILTCFEEDMYVAFAPFILDKNYLMKVFEELQREYYEFVQEQFPKTELPVFIGCVIGTKQTTLGELCRKAERLTRAISSQGRYGYKIMAD